MRFQKKRGHGPHSSHPVLGRGTWNIYICFTKVADCFGWFAVLVVFLFFLLYNGLFQKGPGNVVGDTLPFLENPLKFLSIYVTLPLAIPEKITFHSGNFCNVKLCQLISLENSRTKNQGHWKFQFFSYHAWKFHIFFN